MLLSEMSRLELLSNAKLDAKAETDVDILIGANPTTMYR